MLDALLRALQRRTLRQGWSGGRSIWFVVGSTLWMVNRARRRRGVVLRVRLEPGHGLLVTTRRWGPPRPGRRNG